jgi:uncharacterized membrane protein YeaQ/YmgE (transglycosylase-associated protein family)
LVVAALHLSPGGVLAWIVVGLLAGALAGRITGGRGFGCITNIAVGLIGALIGGFVLSFFVKGTTTEGFFGTLAVALVGSLILIIGVRLVRGAL